MSIDWLNDTFIFKVDGHITDFLAVDSQTPPEFRQMFKDKFDGKVKCFKTAQAALAAGALQPWVFLIFPEAQAEIKCRSDEPERDCRQQAAKHRGIEFVCKHSSHIKFCGVCGELMTYWDTLFHTCDTCQKNTAKIVRRVSRDVVPKSATSPKILKHFQVAKKDVRM